MIKMWIRTISALEDDEDADYLRHWTLSYLIIIMIEIMLIVMKIMLATVTLSDLMMALFEECQYLWSFKKSYVVDVGGSRNRRSRQLPDGPLKSATG